ncbi:MAG: prealbumin-like fold domain-containing protein [Vagococcus fluvialis]
MKKIMIWLSLLIVSLVTVTATSSAEEVTTSPNNVTVELTHETSSETGTTFSVFGITQKDYEYALSQKLELSSQKTKAWIKKNGLPLIKEVWVGKSNKVVFDLPKYNSEQELMYYVILQNLPENEENGITSYEAFPSYVSLDEQDSSYLKIQTKRVSLALNPYFFKYSSGDNQKPLEKAEFIFYRLNELNEREYLIDSESNQFSLIKNKDEARKFTSEKNGLVIMDNNQLIPGTYYFEEVKAPEGFQMTLESKQIELVVSKDMEGQLTMTVKGTELEPVQAGKLPQDIIKQGTPRVLNDPILGKPIEKDPPTKTPSNNKPIRKGYLPQTGESILAVSSFGFVLMFIAYKLMKRGRENE